MKTLTILSTFAVVAVFALSGCMSTDFDNIDEGPYPNNYQDIISMYMKNIAIDPDSLKIEYISSPEKCIVQVGIKRYRCWKVEAYVNAKNRFGGYTGKIRNTFYLKNWTVIQSSDHASYTPRHY